MPSNKTLTILVICLGIVVSIFLITRNSKNIPFLAQNTSSVSTNPYINLSGNTNSDWQKILTNVNPNQNTTTVLTTNGDQTIFDETSLTAQMSRDMFSRYLLIANKDGGATPDDATQIANEILTSPQYTTTERDLYSETNLHITQKSDKETLKKYAEMVNQSLINEANKLQGKEDPLTIFSSAVQTENQSKLTELNPYILSNKNIVNTLLQMEVPKEIASMHVNLLNASGNSLSDLESMSRVFVDPAKSLVAISQFVEDIDNFQTALETINTYYKNKFPNGF